MRRFPAVLACLTLLVAGWAEAQSLTELAAREKKRREALGPDKGPVYNDEKIDSAWIGWRDFRPRDGTFVVQFPAKPTVERSEVSLGEPYGSAVRASYRSDDLKGSRFVVTYTEYPAAFLKAHPNGPFLSFHEPPSLGDSFMHTWQGALARRPALFMSAHYSQVATSLIGRRFYELSVMIDGRASDGRGVGPHSHPFFDSFGVE